MPYFAALCLSMHLALRRRPVQHGQASDPKGSPTNGSPKPKASRLVATFGELAPHGCAFLLTALPSHYALSASQVTTLPGSLRRKHDS
jgi:hypothetical protein